MTNGDISKEVIEFVQKELEYRRRKLWDIFSWCSTMLIAITGGIFALETAAQRPLVFNRWEKGAIIFAVAVITVYAILWMNYHLNREGEMVQALNDNLHLKKLGIPLSMHPPNSRFQVGYRLVLVLLAAAACVVPWYSPHSVVPPATNPPACCTCKPQN